MRFTIDFAVAVTALLSLVAGSPIHGSGNDTAPIAQYLDQVNDTTPLILPLDDNNDTARDAAFQVQKLADNKSIFICEERSYGGLCVLQPLTNGACVNFGGSAKSINQDDNGRVRCDLFSFPNCQGLKLTCGGDCPTLFLLENQLRSLQCFW